LKEAEESIKNAEEAGANAYAAEELDEAKRFHSTSQDLLKSGNYLEAKDVAIRSVQKAKEALYKNVINAETSINEAKSYDGWKYRYALLSQAIVDAKKARQALEQGDFFSSNSYAEKAALEAQKVVRESKKEAFKGRVTSISSGMDKAMHSGVNYFQSEKAKKVYRELADVQGEFTLEKYDYLSTKLDKLDADLEHVITSTPEILDKVLAVQHARLARQKEAGATDFAVDLMDEAERNLRYAKIDYQEQKFSQAYKEARLAIDNLDEIDRRISMDAYTGKASNILDELNEALNKFSCVLELGPKLLQYFSRGPTGKGQYISIAGRMKPDEFRIIVTELYHKARLLEAPSGAEFIHRDFVDMLNDYRLASVYFERLIILDEYEPRSRREIINKAFDLVDKAQQKRSDLQNTYLNREVKMRLVNLP
jgi:hypothetical protein